MYILHVCIDWMYMYMYNNTVHNIIYIMCVITARVNFIYNTAIHVPVNDSV